MTHTPTQLTLQTAIAGRMHGLNRQRIIAQTQGANWTSPTDKIRARSTTCFFLTPSHWGCCYLSHGGYWVEFDKSYWSHLAQGAADSGWAVAMPSYILCPHASIADISRMIAAAIQHGAGKVPGPIVLTGHSAGGHLASYMVCDDSPLEIETQQRIVHTVSISGLHDLRPLVKTEMNAQLQLSDHDAMHLSPAFQIPGPQCRLTAWVGNRNDRSSCASLNSSPTPGVAWEHGRGASLPRASTI